MRRPRFSRFARRDDTGLIALCYVRKAPEDMDGHLDRVVTGLVAKDVRSGFAEKVYVSCEVTFGLRLGESGRWPRTETNVRMRCDCGDFTCRGLLVVVIRNGVYVSRETSVRMGPWPGSLIVPIRLDSTI